MGKRYSFISLCILQALLICLISVSCEVERVFIVDIPESIEFVSEGGKCVYRLRANYDWTASSSEEWCKIIPSSGLGNVYDQEVRIVCEKNGLNDPRECFLSFASGNLVTTATVNQELTPFFSVSPKDNDLSSDAHVLSFVVSTTADYIVKLDDACDSWISISSTRTISTDSVSVSVLRNDTFSPREGKVIFIQEITGLADTVNITQQQNDYLSVSPKNADLERGAQSVDIEVLSNVDWKTVVSDDGLDWITVTSVVKTKALETNTVCLEVSANKTYSPRNASVYFVQSDGDLRDTVRISQHRDVFFEVESPKDPLSNEQQVVEVAVSTNTDYVISTDEEWIVYDKSLSKYPRKLVFSITSNQSFYQREGSVLLMEKGGDKTAEFVIRQKPSATIEAYSDTAKVANDESLVNLRFATNVEYEIVISDKDSKWISVVSAPQVCEMSDVTAALHIEENNLYVDRRATILLKLKDGQLSKPIVIEQQQRLLNPRSEFIAVFGDIQYYTNATYIDLFSKSLNWISKQVDNGSAINCVLHTGDVTQSDILDTQWAFFSKAIRDFYPKVPFISAIGDHDYRWADGVHIYDRNETYFNWFLSLPTTKVVAYYEKGHMENVVIENTIHGRRYYILCLEFGPRVEVVDWANKYVSSHPNLKFIILNHEYLEAGGGIRTTDLKCAARIKNSTFVRPTKLWDDLIKKNDNIVCVLCGHVGGLYALTLLENDFGRQVPQIEHNIQGPLFRYDNWLMLWEFPNDSDTASVKIVNTVSGQLYDNQEELFSFKYR